VAYQVLSLRPEEGREVGVRSDPFGGLLLFPSFAVPAAKRCVSILKGKPLGRLISFRGSPKDGPVGLGLVSLVVFFFSPSRFAVAVLPRERHKGAAPARHRCVAFGFAGYGGLKSTQRRQPPDVGGARPREGSFFVSFVSLPALVASVPEP